MDEVSRAFKVVKKAESIVMGFACLSECFSPLPRLKLYYGCKRDVRYSEGCAAATQRKELSTGGELFCSNSKTGFCDGIRGCQLCLQGAYLGS